MKGTESERKRELRQNKPYTLRVDLLDSISVEHRERNTERAQESEKEQEYMLSLSFGSHSISTQASISSVCVFFSFKINMCTTNADFYFRNLFCILIQATFSLCRPRKRHPYLTRSQLLCRFINILCKKKQHRNIIWALRPYSLRLF